MIFEALANIKCRTLALTDIIFLSLANLRFSKTQLGRT